MATQRRPRFSWRKDFMFETRERVVLGYDGWDVARIRWFDAHRVIDSGWECILTVQGAPTALVETLNGVTLPTDVFHTAEQARQAIVAVLRPYLAGKSFENEVSQ